MSTATLDRPTSLDRLLRENAMSDLRELEVVENDNEVVITGEVSSYYLKQMAQESVRPALAGRRLCNRVRVNLAS